MRHHIIVAAILFSTADFGVAVADDTAAPIPLAPTQTPTEGHADGAQTNLQAEPALREQIDQTKAFLDDKETEVDGQISRLKTEGLIDRRSTTKIRSALDQARGSMTGMAEGMQSDRQYDGWTARMIAYELGMAADTLVLQADKIETELGTAPEGGSDQERADATNGDQRQDLIDTLRETSSLLRKAAQAIASGVK